MNEKIEAKLAALRQAYTEHLPEKIKEISQLWGDVKLNFNKDNFYEFHRAVHSLAGSAGTYGYSQLSQACRDLDVYLQQLRDYSTLNAIQQSEIAHLVECIKDTWPQVESIPIELVMPEKIISKLIFYLGAKKDKFHRELHENLMHLGYELILFQTCEALRKEMEQQLPGVIMLDEHYLDEQGLIDFLDKRPSQISLLCLATKNNLDIRLKAIRAGVSFFIQKPIEIFHLTNQLVQLCDLATREDYRILILDDSETLATYYSLVLEEANMNVRSITSPYELMHELQDFKPNLLLLDLYLPECTGFDIAKIIRQEESYVSLPIIFISTENDRIKQLSILNSCGADDFLTKPVLPQNLISAVKSRAQRSALLNSYIALDSLTKLLNHTYILKQLSFEILRAQRFNQPIAVAMIDLDYFKQINDQYGHPVGDLVLKKMADMFLSRVRKTDFVGRYGGEEFAIIFPNTTPEMALKLCLELCKKVAKNDFYIGGYGFNITLSIGIAHYPIFKTTEDLVAAADRALYKAKVNGRNRVEIEAAK
ncbi:diguanylate cyclase [Legionella sp. km772]|uniref:diguanylate cyclase n=1 Tax=Legionella sp. km772 TaxID=2498111 RepID=UPI000F8E6672|nr:diguanylate cyclase [Legionella sp. km772]RUR04680.1 diguanylate cyclase [Legionella sp. km772]